MTTNLIINSVLAIGALAMVLGGIAWAIASQTADRRHLFVRRAHRHRLVPRPEPETVRWPGELWPAS